MQSEKKKDGLLKKEMLSVQRDRTQLKQLYAQESLVLGPTGKVSHVEAPENIG